jgi:hypothetical protein
MKYLVIAILLMAYSNTWAQVDSSLPAKTVIMDSSCGVALLRQCSRGVPKPIQGYWQVSKQDARMLEENLGKLNASCGKLICIR